MSEWAKLLEQFPELKFIQDEPMRAHCTFRIGGTADYFVEPTISEATRLIDFCEREKLPYIILGNGSNVLISDAGIRGLVICFGKNAAEVTFEDETVVAEAGCMLATLARLSAEKGLSGLEFAAGIPGTLGGALMMNAGAYGGQMADVVTSVRVLSHGKVEDWSKERLDFSYRHSAMMDTEAIILGATMKLSAGDKDEILSQMADFTQRRKDKQPLEFPSAGSTFKRPEGYFAGKLIMDAGLAGYSVGDAQVSKKHCGFVINLGNATASDVKQLMSEVVNKVRQMYGVTLEPEVRFIGEE